MARIDSFLKHLVENNGSDLHLSSSTPPRIRIHGKLAPIPGVPAPSSNACQELLYEIMSEQQVQRFEDTHDLDMAYSLPGVGRFRVSVFEERRGLGAVFRTIPVKIPSLEELKMPAVVGRIAYFTKGLVLVTGPTGSGKSTTLATMIDILNQNVPRHILTIEDPIEFVHKDKKSHISQREVGHHAVSFASALRVALREDPDVILVGEMRDLETMTLTLGAAETGTLVFTTVHTNSASKTIDRIIDVFPANEQEHARLLLSTTLQAVMSQQLMPTKDGKGRVVATEVMIANSAIKNMIREGRTYQIPSSIVSGAKEGMIAMDTSLKTLYQSGMISAETAYTMAADKETFEKLLGSQ
ncbi:MAG: type IV pili twitching motility protein PilT [Deltaproteobacteria bacterium RBG_13_61_14]|nr:MAG: type IV pili twitching motility protein PilT [Deltaproteobacteria bacterium RBG_13_61_14]